MAISYVPARPPVECWSNDDVHLLSVDRSVYKAGGLMSITTTSLYYTMNIIYVLQLLVNDFLITLLMCHSISLIKKAMIPLVHCYRSVQMYITLHMS